MNKNKGDMTVWVAVAAALLIAAALIIFPSWQRSGGTLTLGGGDTSVPCLVPNLPLATHIHPELSIIMDGKSVTIPAEIGLKGVCERVIHTHDASGQIHVESQTVRDYTLGDFFSVWGEKIQKDAYNLVMTVDGTPSKEFENLVLKENQKISLTYTKVAK